MAELLLYKCPCCGGNIEFDSTLQKLKCPYCDTEFDVESLKAYDDDLKSTGTDDIHWDDQLNSEWKEGEKDGLRIYVCATCGGEIICDDTTAATKCPYCDNPVVMKGQLSNDLRPDYVIPFKLDKNAAKDALMRHMQKKPLLPKVFKEENRIDEIKGVYVPFWLYDAEADADIRYRATRVRTYTTPKYHCTETSHYSVTRSGAISFNHIPVDGSTKMADELMESIEPFDFSQAVDFQSAYLSGYLADRYDVSVDDSQARANERIKQSAKEALRSTVNGYSTVIEQQSSVKVAKGKTKYVLYPVWILNTTWRDQKYTFAMNGQTGKFVGDLPVDGRLFTLYLLLGTAICSAVVFGLLTLIGIM